MEKEKKSTKTDIITKKEVEEFNEIINPDETQNTVEENIDDTGKEEKNETLDNIVDKDELKNIEDSVENETKKKVSELENLKTQNSLNKKQKNKMKKKKKKKTTHPPQYQNSIGFFTASLITLTVNAKLKSFSNNEYNLDDEVLWLDGETYKEQDLFSQVWGEVIDLYLSGDLTPWQNACIVSAYLAFMKIDNDVYRTFGNKIKSIFVKKLKKVEKIKKK